jgi:hypothetical protein
MRHGARLARIRLSLQKIPARAQLGLAPSIAYPAPPAIKSSPQSDAQVSADSAKNGRKRRYSAPKPAHSHD